MSNSNSERYIWESKYRDVVYLFNNNKEWKTEKYNLYLNRIITPQAGILNMKM